MSVQYEIIVHGRVQGVGFRAAASRKARSLDLKGYVENLPDGTVRAVVNGNLKQCNLFTQWCREGSGYSWVEKLELKEMKAENTQAFYIRY